MKIAFVVQRYGLEISGGAELHCRWVAEHMRKHWEVEVLTTKALDYITWNNYYPDSVTEINQVPVKRFPVKKVRNPERFGKLQNFILANEHTAKDEIRWLEEEGPYSPALIQYLKNNQENYDYFIFFSYRYYHSFWGIKTVPQKSVLVPTAERDDIIHLNLFKDLFRTPQAFIYNSYEEKNMINTLAQNEEIPGEIVGVGSEIPDSFSTNEFLRENEIDGEYIIYLGRIDQNKGCAELFDFFLKFKKETGSDIKLVLVGSTVLKIPHHCDIIYLGFLSEEDKFSVLNGARFLCMPSFYESLSMVTLEAWAMQKPVLANARCEVLKGQCMRSNAGLYYSNYSDFREALTLLLSNFTLCEKMGKNGREYFLNNYTWEIIEEKYISLLERLGKEK